jgi:hypothetical protein
MTRSEIHRLTALASRAKTKVKQRGARGVSELSHDETLALAFIADTVLSDYEGPLTRGKPDLSVKPKELETA